MKGRISQQDLDREIRSHLVEAGAPEPPTLGDVLNHLSDRVPSSARASRGSAPRLLVASVVVGFALIATAIGAPLLLLGPSQGSTSPTGTPAGTEVARQSPEVTPEASPTASLAANPTDSPTSTDTPEPTPPPSESAAPPPYMPAAKGHMTVARSSQVAVAFENGTVLIVGGDEGDQATAELYDPAKGTFTRTGDPVEDRYGPAGTLLKDGTVLITGGASMHDSPSRYLNTAEIYDPETGKFRATGSMAVYRHGHTATRLDDGRVLVVGGDQFGDNHAEIYDPNSGKFTSTGATAEWTQAHTATLLPDKRVLIAGERGSLQSTQAELFDPATGEFTLIESVPLTSYERTMATALSGGRVLIAGGLAQDGTPTRRAMVYDSGTGEFSLTGEMVSLRVLATSTRLRDGRVLIAGGFVGSDYLSSAEVYDPTTGKFSAVGSMSTAREGHSATLLPNGRVLIAGGFNGTAVLDSAELFDPDTNKFIPLPK